MVDINKLVQDIHKNAVEHGWWEEKRSFGDIIALCHAELSEALEEFRNGHEPIEVYYNGEKPEGIPIELADVIIRIMDYCGYAGIDLESALLQKIKYNETRPYRHGGKRL